MEEGEVNGQRLIALQSETYEVPPRVPPPTRSMIRKAAVQYTKDVETILTDLVDKGNRCRWSTMSAWMMSKETSTNEKLLS